jgi:hypothetical protein
LKIIVSYYIESSILALTCAIFALRWLPGAIYGWLRIAIPDALTKRRHPQAVLNAAAAFLDSAAYLSISVSIAGIVFDKKSNLLLYDDKLGQASTLLAINAPVAILLLTFKPLERRKTRYLLVLVDVLLTLAIQFPFKKAKSFDPSLSVCLGWKENNLRDKFQHLYIVIGVWGILVALFFIYQSVAWLSQHRFYKSTPVTALSNPGSGLAAPSQAQSRGGASRSIGDPRDPSQHPTTCTSRLVRCTMWIYNTPPWSEIIAIGLAIYGVVNSSLALHFIGHLRGVEKDIATHFQDNQWGYGQILALFIWVPVIAEYIQGLVDIFWRKEDVQGQGRAKDD